MANALPMIITGAPNLRIEEDLAPNEYYGPMTYIRVDGSGEHRQDENGLVLWLNGTYSPDLLARIATAINGRL